jgi:hypothetical protein
MLARRRRLSARFARFRKIRATLSSTLDAGAAGARIIFAATDGAISRESIATTIRSLTQKATYPDVEFHTCDVLDVPAIVTREFDIIYMLNAFYAFADQRGALAALRKVAKTSARLVIFDYAISKPADLSVEGQVFIPHPIQMSGIGDLIRGSGWEPGTVEDLSADYTRWYAAFVERIRRKQNEIEKIGGAEWYRFVLSMYSGLHDVIASGKLGGAIVHAIAA